MVIDFGLVALYFVYGTRVVTAKREIMHVLIHVVQFWLSFQFVSLDQSPVCYSTPIKAPLRFGFLLPSSFRRSPLLSPSVVTECYL